MWFKKKKRFYYKNLLEELDKLLKKNGVTPIHLFYEPKIIDYLSLPSLPQVLAQLAFKNIYERMNKEELEFAHFITRLSITRQKPINLLLDTPAEYDCQYLSAIGWKDNPHYKEEIENYREKIDDFEKLKNSLKNQRAKLWEEPEADTYRYVKQEYDQAKCKKCLGTGTLPSINNRSGINCPHCRGTGYNAYVPRVTRAQRETANGFKTKMDSLNDPEFTSFPCRKNPVFLKVVYGGHIFLIDAEGNRSLLTT